MLTTVPLDSVLGMCCSHHHAAVANSVNMWSYAFTVDMMRYNVQVYVHRGGPANEAPGGAGRCPAKDVSHSNLPAIVDSLQEWSLGVGFIVRQLGYLGMMAVWGCRSL